MKPFDPRTMKPASRRYLLTTLQGLLNYIEDGSVVEVRPCGFVQEIHNTIAAVKRGAQ